MRKKPRLKPPAPLNKSLPPIDEEEMAFALQILQAGLRLRMPMDSPEKKGIEAGDAAIAHDLLNSIPEGLRDQFLVRDTRVAPKDTKESRAAFAILDHYRDHPLREAILYRAMSFQRVVNQHYEEFLSWTRQATAAEAADSGPGMVMLHPAVIEAVATAPTNKWGVFDPRTFFETVKKIAKEKYPELENKC